MEMMIEEGLDPNNLDNKVVPGKYQFLVQEVNETAEHIEITAEVIASKDPHQLGKTVKQKFFKTGTDAKKTQSVQARILTLAFATGISTPEKIMLAKQAKRSIHLDFELARGRSIFGEIRVNNKGFTEFTWTGMYHLTHDQCKGDDWPRTSRVPAVSAAPPAESLSF